MSVELCELWQQLVAAPSDSALRQQLQGTADALIDHVDDCESCQALAATVDPILLFEAFGAVEDTVEEQDSGAIQGMLEAAANDEESVARAVTDALLPSLPDSMGLSSLGPDVDAVALFKALDSVRMLLKRSLRRRISPALKTLTMKFDGSILLNAEIIIESDVMAAEIRQYAGLSEPSARRVLEWIPLAARSQPHLLPGVNASPRLIGIWLEQVEWNPTSGNLFERWKPVEVPRAASAATRPAGHVQPAAGRLI